MNLHKIKRFQKKNTILFRLFYEGELTNFEVPDYAFRDISGVNPSLWINPELALEYSEAIKPIFENSQKRSKVVLISTELILIHHLKELGGLITLMAIFHFFWFSIEPGLGCPESEHIRIACPAFAGMRASPLIHAPQNAMSHSHQLAANR